MNDDEARRDEERTTQRRASILGLNYIDTSEIKDKTLYKLLGISELYDLRVIPIKADSQNITFGVTNTTSQITMKDLQHRFLDQRVAFGLISETGYREYMKLYDPPKKVEYTDITIKEAGSEDLVAQVSATLEQVRADDILAYLVQQAHRLNASDIHLEAEREYTRVRFRIDGVLHTIAKLTMEKYRILISAVASAGSVSTSSDESQQGHIAQRLKMADGSEVDLNLRLEATPTVNGMSVVMRLFNMSPEMYQLDRLGLTDYERSIIDDIISKPSGLVMVVGPTGSGKTTTLYSMLNTLNTDERKIITIEDPVEYQFEGITQIPALSKNSKSTGFADRLRAVLRLDPDIVMVGEIRDMDTAKTALQAALTGHLVLATFHASSAAAALSRIADIIGENPLFVSAIRLVMAQRLVRRLDDETKQAYDPDEKTLHKLQKIIDELPEGVEKPSLDGLQLFAAGSSPENPYGYTGQMAVREQFLMKGEVSKVLGSGRKLTSQEIEEAAIKSGMLTMHQDGILKVIAGETTLDEVYRVIG